MKLHNIDEDNIKKREDSMSLALMAAKNMSSRSGFGWVFLDKEGKHLCSGSFIIGKLKNTNVLVEQLQAHLLNVRELIITGDFAAAMLDLDILLPLLDASTCISITIGYQSILKNPSWEIWQRSWNGEINYLPLNNIVERLHKGPQKMKLLGLPWVTSVSAGTLGHHPLKLSDLSDEFGFNAYLKMQAKHCQSILYTSSQSDILPIFEQDKTEQTAYALFQVDSVLDVRNALKLISSQSKTCTLLLCDIGFLKDIIEHDLCDEIVHHIKFNTGESSTNDSQPISTPFEGWSILDCETLGQCIRLMLSTESQNKPSSQPLNIRLN